MDPIYVNAAEPLLQHQARTLRGPSNTLIPTLIGDQVTLSPEARRYAAGVAPIGEGEEPVEAELSLLGEDDDLLGSLGGEDSDALTASDAASIAAATGDEEAIQGIEAVGEGSPEAKDEDSKELTTEEKTKVTKLQARDAEVRAHEAAHIAASGGMAGAASYTYATGPDGKRYAIGGEVSISSPPTTDPAQALVNAERMQAAALAPANPSGQDRAVAARAASIAARARVAMAEEEAEIQKAAKDDQEVDVQDGTGTDDEESVEVAPTQIDPARMGGPTLFGPAEHLHSDGCSYCSASAARYRIGV
jgi:hypothetical protein